MPKPEEFSELGLYGRKDIFEKRIKEGYTGIALGGGEWVGDSRIVRICIFYHPDGRIATYEHPKDHDGTHTMGGVNHLKKNIPKKNSKNI